MKVLFCDEGYSEARRRLAALDPALEIAACPRDSVRDYLSGVDVVVPYMATIDAAIIRAGSFGLIQQFGVGLETVDVGAATAAGVWVARVPSAGTGNAESVAEHALLLMLALARRLPQAFDALRARRLGEPSGITLAGKTACIVGLGSAGSALAIRLSALGMRLIAARKNVGGAVPHGVNIARTYDLAHLREAVSHADFIIITARFEHDARHLFNRAVLAAVKPGAFVVNVARGAFIDHEALSEALRGGRIAGAGLDVLEGEPIAPSDPLLALNVIATPHIAGVTDASYEGIASQLTASIRRYAAGEPPLHAVNAPSNPRGRVDRK